MKRRDLLRATLATASGFALSGLPTSASARDFTAADPRAKGVTAYLKDECLLVRADNLPVLSYRAQASQKYPYFYPLSGPRSGLSVTTESAIPYPHHRGLWLGCDPLNGGNYWADNGLESGQIVSTSLTLNEAATQGNQVVFNQSCRWKRSGSEPFADSRRFAVTVEPGRHTIIDCSFKITAKEDISIRRAKHSFFAMRAAADLAPTYGGTLVNSEGGTGAKGTYGKAARWCGYFGPRRLRPDVVEGIVIMDHPKNFGGNCLWFTRDYGHLSPSPFNFLDKPWTLDAGEGLELAYRVVLFAGTPKEARLEALYNDWST